MTEDLKMISYVLHKDPALTVGFLLIGLSGVLLVHIQLKLQNIGYKFPYLKYLTKRNWEVLRDYLRVRRQQNWSPWPAYLILPLAVTGVISLVVGIFRL